jgi:MFS family permease
VYLSSIDRLPAKRPDSVEPAGKGKLALVGSNVFALGAVSLITDVSSEMVTAILPVYLVVGLSLTPMGYGMVDGIYTGATAVLRLVGGYVADRVRRRKAVAGIGYAMSAVAKLGLLAASPIRRAPRTPPSPT